MAYAKIAGNNRKQEPVWKGPLDVKRSDTDSHYIIALGVFIMFWVAIAIYAYYDGDTLEVHYTNVLGHVDIYQMVNFFGKHIHDARYIILEFTLLSLTLLVVYIMMFRWTTKILLCCTILLMTVLLILFNIFMFLYTDLAYFHPILLVTVIVAMSSIYIIFIYAFFKTGIDMVCKVLKESCKAMFFFPSTLFLMVAQFILQVLLLTFAGSVYVYLKTIRVVNETEFLAYVNESSSEMENNSTDDWLDYPFYDPPGYVPFYVHLFQVFNLICYLWVCSFIMGLGRMVLVAIFSTWYHVKDKSFVPLSTVPKCFVAIVSHHTGTIAYGSSICSTIPMFQIIWTDGRNKLKEIIKKPILIFSWILMVSKFAYDSLSMTAIHGKSFKESGKEIFGLFLKYPVSFLAINTVSEYIIFLGSLLIPVLSLFATTGYVVWQHDNMHHGTKVTAIMIVTFISLFMSMTFFSVFRAASNTIRYCYLEDSKFANESEMNMYEIQVDDMIKDVEDP